MSQIIYSQHEEQNIIQSILDRFAVNNSAVEIGINTGAKGNGKTLQGNTVFLQQQNWACLWIDADTDHDAVVKKTVYPENIVDILDQYLDNNHIGVFSIDIDSEDWYVVRAVLESNYQPEVFVCETNSYVDPMQDLIMPIGHRRSQRPKSICHGATLTAFNNLFKKFNYNFYCTSRLGMNGFWIHKSMLVQSAELEAYRHHRHPLTTNWSRSHQHDHWVDSKTLLS